MSFVSLFGCAPVRSLYKTFDLTDRLLGGDFIRVDEEPTFTDVVLKMEL